MSLSFIIPYVAIRFRTFPEQLFELFSISTPVGGSIQVEKIYINCTIYVYHKDTMVNLFKLDITDFDIILD